MIKTELSGAELARQGGVQPPTIQAAKNNGKLIQSENKNYDLYNEINRTWCINHNVKLPPLPKPKSKPKKKSSDKKNAGKVKAKSKKSKSSGGDPAGKSDDNLKIQEWNTPTEILDGTVRNLLYINRGWAGAKAAADVLDKLLSAEKKSVEVRTRRLELIEKEVVTIGIFQYLEILQQQIFDGLESQINQEISVTLSHCLPPKIEVNQKSKERAKKIIIESRKNITAKAIRQAKKGVTQALTRLKSKYDNEDDDKD